MKRIRLTKGKYTIVDDIDFLRFGLVNWGFDGRYAATKITVGRKPRKIYLHRIILNPPFSFETDHINRDKLDNRRVNLRAVSRQENNINRKTPRNNKSGYKGVCWDSKKRKWLSFVKRNGCNIFFKRFSDKEEAYKARQEFLGGGVYE